MRSRSISLLEVATRPALTADDPPAKLPWDDPAFSRRMLAEHLDQRHDMASRRLDIVGRHVEWICEELLEGRPGSVLDLGCGPGLYLERFAARGWSCVGIDISPASIEYARRKAAEDGLDCRYEQADFTTADLGEGFDLAILMFGEFNTFDRPVATELTSHIGRALRPGGLLLIEAHTRSFVSDSGAQGPSWYSSREGLFAPAPHLVLSEQVFDEASATTLSRYIVIDAESATAEIFGERLVAYSDDEYRSLLTGAGFGDLRVIPQIADVPVPGMVVLVGRRRGSEGAAARGVAGRSH